MNYMIKVELSSVMILLLIFMIFPHYVGLVLIIKTLCHIIMTFSQFFFLIFDFFLEF